MSESHQRTSNESATGVDVEAVLRQRARRLAEVADEGGAAGETIGLTLYRVGTESFAMETRFVREVFHPRSITPVPDCPPFLLGVTNLRGEVLAVMNPALLTGKNAPEADVPWVIVLGEDRAELGVAVDEVLGNRAEPRTSVLPPPKNDAGTAPLTRGVLADATILLDAAAMMHGPELRIGD